MLGLAIAWLLFVPVADWLAHHDVGSVRGTLHETAVDNARGRLLTLGAGLVAVAALVFTALNFSLLRRNSEQADQWQRRTHELTEQGQVTDRYTKAIEQLGSDKLDVRIGGIYALERIARDSARDHPAVMEVLTAFIREHSREPWPPQDHPDKEQERSTRPDVQAAVTVVGRRDAERDIRPINLTGADLTGADLTSAFLSGAQLSGAQLPGADFTGAFLGRADLRDTFLGGAMLIRADLTGARLDGADLAVAFLGGASLAGASLGYAQLPGAQLSGADLTRAYLSGADLTRAYLTGADFAGARLDGADFAGARLDGADFAGARLDGADFAGARLDGADFAGARLDDADFADARLDDSRSALLAAVISWISRWALRFWRGGEEQFAGLVAELLHLGEQVA